MSQIPGRQSYTSTSATVGGRRELIEDARRRQQELQSQKAAEHAVKLKEKEAEKREKKIKQWESMHGRGAGHFVGGSDNILCTTQAERDQIKQEEVAKARCRMQTEHNNQVTHASQMDRIKSSDIDQNAEKMRQREEAKRQQKIAAWEKMNGNFSSSGNVLGRSGVAAVSSNPRDQGAMKGYFQATAGASTSQSSSYNGFSFVRNQQTTSSTANQSRGDCEDDISEEVKRERMRAARLRMQQNMDQKVANQKQQH